MGACLVLISTVANLVQLTVLAGDEFGFVCLTLCTLDGMLIDLITLQNADIAVGWTVGVIHWLVVATESEQKPAVVSVLAPCLAGDRTLTSEYHRS
jgi:hypothetical protein